MKSSLGRSRSLFSDDANECSAGRHRFYQSTRTSSSSRRVRCCTHQLLSSADNSVTVQPIHAIQSESNDLRSLVRASSVLHSAARKMRVMPRLWHGLQQNAISANKHNNTAKALYAITLTPHASLAYCHYKWCFFPSPIYKSHGVLLKTPNISKAMHKYTRT